jgi:hypothetical protein
LRSKITAAATTGPASGPLPASSTPASGIGWDFSSLKLGGMRGGIAKSPLPAKAGESHMEIWWERDFEDAF